MRPAVRTELIEILRLPRTYEETSKILGVNYQTARRWVQELRDEGLVDELMQRAEGKLMFQLNSEAEGQEIVLIPFGLDKRLRVHQIVAAFKSMGMDTQAEDLAFLLSRSRWRGVNLGLDPGAPERVREGFAFPVEIRRDLRETLKELKMLTGSLEHIILREDLWADDGSLWDRAGADDVLDKLELLADGARNRQSDKRKTS